MACEQSRPYDAAMDRSCGHCGSTRPLVRKDSVLLRTDPFTSDGDRYSWFHVVTVYLCEACGEPTLWFHIQSDGVDGRLNERALYPIVRDNSALPEKVRKRLNAALKVKKADPD